MSLLQPMENGTAPAPDSNSDKVANTPQTNEANLYLAYFDTLGFECIENLTDWDKRIMWAELSNKPITHKFPVGALLMRAKANPQRHPEIYTFRSLMTTKEIKTLADHSPQALADLLRQQGNPVYVTPKQYGIIS